MWKPFYSPDFSVRDDDPVQRALNDLYGYENDLGTKVTHRNRLNLFFLLTQHLVNRGVIVSFGSALDIGCHAGVYSKILSDFGFRHVLGIDVNEQSIAKASKTFGSYQGCQIRFKVQDAEQVDLSKRYDLVLCSEVIEHTRQPLVVIENIKTSLARGGVAIISVPNSISFPFIASRVARRLQDRYTDDFARHLEYPFYRTLRLFEGEGLRRVATEGSNLFLNAPLLQCLYHTPIFRTVNAANFRLSRLWPLKYFAQSLFIVVKREGGSVADGSPLTD